MNTLKRLITPATIASPYGYWIDLLRGVAAVTILFWHYQHFGLSSRDLAPFYDWFRYLYDYGELAVWLFWVISGFVFAQVYFIIKYHNYLAAVIFL